MITFHDKNLIDINNLRFVFIQELNPERDSTGQIIEFLPQERYAKSATSKLNRHGGGSFCKFSINAKWIGCSGVYALFAGKELLYIGLCEDLHKRFNMGYGNISPKNCFTGGQSTNCKINKMILSQYINGNQVNLYFLETQDYQRIERMLIDNLKPPYNGFGTSITITPKITKVNANIIYRKETPQVTAPRQTNSETGQFKTSDVVNFILEKFAKAKSQGATSVFIKSGDIHNELGLVSRMPTVCGAMRKLMKSGDIVHYAPPSGNSSTLRIEYFL